MKLTADEAKAFGSRLKEIREAAHLNRVEFAKQLNISPAYVTYLEKGERDGKPVNPTSHFIESVCHKFGCTYQWLTMGTGRRDSSIREKVIARVGNLSDVELRRLNRILDELFRTPMVATFIVLHSAYLLITGQLL